MAILLFVGIVVYILVFFASVFFSLKFQFGEESNDERGRKIQNTSYGIAFPLVILGWFIIYLIDSYVSPFSFESYKIAVWYLITGTYIIYTIILFSLKRSS